MSEMSSLADTRARLPELVARVAAHHEQVIVTVNGRPTAVLVAVDDLEALEETLAVLSEAATLRDLRAADRELAGGEAENEADLATAMASRRARP
jgi:prevent-host-death family protein